MPKGSSHQLTSASTSHTSRLLCRAHLCGSRHSFLPLSLSLLVSPCRASLVERLAGRLSGVEPTLCLVCSRWSACQANLLSCSGQCSCQTPSCHQSVCPSSHQDCK